ncbi:putative DD41D transposase [Trichonephila clavipes]|nr:putative DD41D transposase [Trichonephila clavipes]
MHNRGNIALRKFFYTYVARGNRGMRSERVNLESDEAHFWLNGYVNKQNCRFWSEANPQVYVETPLHPEKLTVWCALWAGGILLQKR